MLFLGTGCALSSSNTALPSSLSTDPFVAYLWDLNNNNNGGWFQYHTHGTSPGRAFSLNHRCTTNFPESAVVETTITLFESTGLITVQYHLYSGSVAGGGATIGMQTAGGSNATARMISLNVPMISPTSTALSFQPSP